MKFQTTATLPQMPHPKCRVVELDYGLFKANLNQQVHSLLGPRMGLIILSSLYGSFPHEGGPNIDSKHSDPYYRDAQKGTSDF